jgi:hypothetical protein
MPKAEHVEALKEETPMLKFTRSCPALLIMCMSLVTLTAHAAAATQTCADLAKLALKDVQFGKPIADLKATLVAADGATPEHCQIDGTIWPETKYMLKLPSNGWNGVFVMTGNGGPAGAVRPQILVGPLAQGYAVAGDSGGHLGDRPLFSFAYNPADNSNPNGPQKLIDFAYRSIHESAHLSKQIINAFYGRPAQRSYYVGGSQGGRQGLKNAQLYPEDFDGWVVGYPVLDLSGQTLAGVWNARAVVGGPGAIRPSQLPALAAAAQAKCDRIDGVTDQLISDAAACQVNAQTDLPSCTAGEGGEGGDACFTPEQKAAVAKVLSGPTTSKGERVFLGAPLGSSISVAMPDGSARSLWLGFLTPTDAKNPRSSISLAYGESYIQYFVYQDPKWDWQSGNFDDFKQRTASLRKTVDAVDPDLKRVQAGGKKILQYHGLADVLVTPYVSSNYYDKVQAKLGDAATQSFYKLYLVPGMGHGPGMGPMLDGDWLAVLRAWVEQSKEPQSLPAKRAADPRTGTPAMTRPLCPYPQVAQYKGTGDTHAAENFACGTRK